MTTQQLKTYIDDLKAAADEADAALKTLPGVPASVVAFVDKADGVVDKLAALAERPVELDLLAWLLTRAGL